MIGARGSLLDPSDLFGPERHQGDSCGLHVDGVLVTRGATVEMLLQVSGVLVRGRPDGVQGQDALPLGTGSPGHSRHPADSRLTFSAFSA